MYGRGGWLSEIFEDILNDWVKSLVLLAFSGFLNFLLSRAGPYADRLGHAAALYFGIEVAPGAQPSNSHGSPSPAQTLLRSQVRFLTVLVLVLSASLIHSYSSGPPALAPSPENFSQVHAFGSPSLEPLGLSLAGGQARDPSDSTRDPVGGQEDNSYSAVSAGALAETERRESHEKDNGPLALVSRGATW
eukprot:CAMPEP_0172599608 /NCGR_PEP_ID=MMETSP1068-20121228/19702_1 /TAXON_ID=35684 /ORGANISM="Pseudopedinella elastica, Strain CCMP716" /LENGTH=189 /DNA_ID=CAMNT_0013399907 /DNA_START=142 /DNA_END=708 /DNA_ORIENTATION=+